MTSTRCSYSATLPLLVDCPARGTHLLSTSKMALAGVLLVILVSFTFLTLKRSKTWKVILIVFIIWFFLNRTWSRQLGEADNARVFPPFLRHCQRWTGHSEARTKQGTAGTVQSLPRAIQSGNTLRSMSPSGDSREHLPMGCKQPQVEALCLATHCTSPLWYLLS